METIDDIRREEGNPNAGEPNGPIEPINREFHNPGAGANAVALVVFIIGVFTTLVGIWTLVIPISVVGLGVICVAAFLFARAQAEKRGALIEQQRNPQHQ